MNKGSELDKQIYPEGENTWGCKEGWLDVEDVKKSLQNYIKRLREVGIETHDDTPQIIGVNLAILELRGIMGGKLR